jgi:hypothetical protein
LPRCLPKPASGLLARRVGLGFEFVNELIELVEINSGPKAERVWNDLRSRVPERLRLLAQTGTKRLVDYVLERQPEIPRAASKGWRDRRR